MDAKTTSDVKPVDLDLIKNITQDLLDKLTVKANLKIEPQDEAVLVNIETEEAGPLIGYHGKTLEALQLVVNQIIYKKLGCWIRVWLTVGDYRERRQQQLIDLAQTTAEKALQTQNQIVLSDLSAAERRIIHLHLSQHPQVTTESFGEGRQRKLVIKPKTA